MTDPWRQHLSELRRFVGKRVANPHEAEDIVQDVLTRAHEAMHQLESVERRSAWLARIAARRIIDHYRSRRPTEELPEDLAAVEAEDNPVERLAQCLPAMVERLPDIYRDAVRMSELDGMPQQEVAHRLGISLSGAKSRVQRGRTLLRSLVEACCQIVMTGSTIVDYARRESGLAAHPETDSAGCVLSEESSSMELRPLSRRNPLDGNLRMNTPDNTAVPVPACCGGPAPAGVAACCVKDADAKAAGNAGCGCATAEPSGSTVASSTQPALPVAVIGAGPVGLAATARLIERGLTPLILEAGSSVGANLLAYGHVQLFSSWHHSVDLAMASLLKPTGWQPPPDEALPLARQIVEQVLQPFAALPQVAQALHLGVHVESISREGFDKVSTVGREAAPFVIRGRQNGRRIEWRARAVIDASGTWTKPNPLGANGLPAIGEPEAADRIYYGIPDVQGEHRGRYAGKRTLVVGAGHSAANALLGLAELARTVRGTRLAWSVRTPTLMRVFGGGSADALPARGQLGDNLRRLRDEGGLEFFGGLRINAVHRKDGALTVEGLDASGQKMQVRGIDEIVCATGQRPDLTLASELRLKLDPWLESTEALGPLIDPNLHSCGSVRPHGHRELSHPEAGFYTVGVKSYGRAPTFLMATGFEQVRSVVAAIAGDLIAADRVELNLPETGICSTGTSPSTERTERCCGVAAATSVST